MRVITIRHDKSSNNLLLEESIEKYNALRSHDPDITSQCESNCKKLAQLLKEYDFNIDKFYCSGHLRALKTMSYIANEYNPDLPQEYFPEIYELGGIYLDKKGMAGLNKAEILKQFPKVIIPDSIDISEGWYNKDHKETNEEFKARVKKAIHILKDMASKIEVKEETNDDNNNIYHHQYTICLISHNAFLNAFYSLLCSSEYLIDNHSFSHSNLGVSSFIINHKREIAIEFINFTI